MKLLFLFVVLSVLVLLLIINKKCGKCIIFNILYGFLMLIIIGVLIYLLKYSISYIDSLVIVLMLSVFLYLYLAFDKSNGLFLSVLNICKIVLFLLCILFYLLLFQFLMKNSYIKSLVNIPIDNEYDKNCIYMVMFSVLIYPVFIIFINIMIIVLKFISKTKIHKSLMKMILKSSKVMKKITKSKITINYEEIRELLIQAARVAYIVFILFGFLIFNILTFFSDNNSIMLKILNVFNINLVLNDDISLKHSVGNVIFVLYIYNAILLFLGFGNDFKSYFFN